MSPASSPTLREDLKPPATAQGNHTDSDSNDGFLIPQPVDDRWNYALLICLYTLQGIPMGLSASIPFLIQQKAKLLAASSGTASSAARSLVQAATMAAAESSSSVVSSHAANAARLSYNANAIFSLCSWPFSLKLLWAPIVDAIFIKRLGRRKSWLVPVQIVAGITMVFGSNFVETQLGLSSSSAVTTAAAFDVRGVTIFFFFLYFLMATQDIAVDGWALTMLSKQNRGRGPVCNSIGQNIGYFLSFVGFLALNDAESCNSLWRPLFGLKQNPNKGLVSLGAFIRSMGYFMLVITTFVAVFKRETEPVSQNNVSDAYEALLPSPDNTDSVNDGELDASQLGLKETYHRLWEVCKLPAVKMLFLVLLTYRLPTALSDNVKFLKAVDFGLSKSTTALLSPTLILPLGIMVPIIANKIWHDRPLRQFMLAYRYRVTLIPLFDVLLLKILQHRRQHNSSLLFWTLLVLSTAAQATVNSLQFNAQMTFFAHRVDPAIGGSYMTLLNTAANLGGTWPSSVIMWTISRLSTDPICQLNEAGQEICKSGRDPYFVLQLIASVLGCVWVLVLGRTVQRLGALPDDAWRTHLLDETNADDDSKPTKNYDPEALQSVNVDLGGGGKGILASPNWIPRSQFSKEL